MNSLDTCSTSPHEYNTFCCTSHVLLLYIIISTYTHTLPYVSQNLWATLGYGCCCLFSWKKVVQLWKLDVLMGCPSWAAARCIYNQGEEGMQQPNATFLRKGRCPGTKQQAACRQGLAARPHRSAHNCPRLPREEEGELHTTAPRAESCLRATPRAPLPTSSNSSNETGRTNANGT